MKILLVLASFFLAASAYANNGATAGCYSVVVAVPSSFGPMATTKYLKTGSTLCVTESNVKELTDHFTSTGKFKVTISNNVGNVAVYRFGAKQSEGAAGTIYTTYAADEKSFSEADVALLFAMRNDKIKVGTYAGRVTINSSTELTLLKK